MGRRNVYMGEYPDAPRASDLSERMKEGTFPDVGHVRNFVCGMARHFLLS